MTNIIKKIKTFCYMSNPVGSYNSLSSADEENFKDLLNVWRPKENCKPPGIIIRWLLSTWCNYGCMYCGQNHKRDLKSHAFDNHDVSQWLLYFDKHFNKSRVSLVLTGGEPMLDIKNMHVLLKGLTESKWIENIRIDTNASWNPGKYSDIDTSKILLMCTFHPSQTDETKFMQKAKLLLSSGWKIGMVNYVMTDSQVGQFEKIRNMLAEIGIPLHANPLWNSHGQFSDEALAILKRYLHPIDFKYRGGITSPYKMKCLFPSIAYEMQQTGAIYVGCHNAISGNIFSENIPALPAGIVKCPFKKCVCLDKYSFLKGINRNTTLNPFKQYHELLLSII